MKQLTVIIILMLIPLVSMPQSKQSEQRFQQGIELFNSQKYEEALLCFKKCDALDKKKLKSNDYNYFRAELKMADCYNGLADNCYERLNYDDAIRLENLTIEIRKKILGENHHDYAAALIILGRFYHKKGNDTEAIRLVTNAMNILKRIGNDDAEYAESLNDLALYNDYNGDTPEAIRLGTAAIEVWNKCLGNAHRNYAIAVSNIARYYFNLGNVDEAISKETAALEIFKKSVGENHFDYATSLNNLAWYNNYKGNHKEAIRLGTLAVETYKKVLGNRHSYYAIGLNNLAGYYSETDNYNEAKNFLSESIQIKKDILGNQHPSYALSLNNLAELYCNLGNYNEAIRVGTNALSIRKKVLGAGHFRIAESLKQLADIYLIVGKYDSAANYYLECYKSITSFILKNFSSMTNKERADFWNKNSQFFNKNLPYAAYVHPDSALCSLAYDSQIFAKGLLLNTELEIQKLIEQSGDSTFSNRYYKIKQDRARLDNLYQKAVENRKINTDSLQIIIDNEERLLVASSKALGDYTKNLSISWKDIQKNLKNNDLAIEFTIVKDSVNKQIFYVALVLNNQMQHPKLVKLFSTDDFWCIRTKDYYTSPLLYNLVWQPLEPYLKNVKTVYFSPAGHFHKIGIEYLPDDKGNIFAEQFDTYRLSSTRELTLTHPVNPERKATTYGGIQYDFSEEEWQNLKNENDSIRRQFRDIPQINNDFRGNDFGYLAGTKIESVSIAKLLFAAHYDIDALTDADATEESFKRLSGSNIKILHIGTNGFYQTENDLISSGYSFFKETQNDEDRSLSCSGLLFAGANSALDPLRHIEIPDGTEDGILTAKEISRLDFSGLDLVVLSACQTGLGKITSEGVFGLQRGFKKAGAQTIVMSLWEVSDEATQLLMIEFFKNLTGGQSKRAAFLNAQKIVRQKYPNPLYWAAFIMVDGME